VKAIIDDDRIEGMSATSGCTAVQLIAKR